MGKLKAVIIEDEAIAAQRLAKMLKSADEQVEVIDVLSSVRQAVKWFKENDAHLAFFDIQLADGLSFEVFQQVEITCPVIFTTAYDQYALKAFKVNSIDYLLKPIDGEELKKALQKFKLLTEAKASNEDFVLAVQKAYEMIGKQEYKSRYVIKLGEHIKIINVDQVAFFKSMEKATFLYQSDGKRFLIDDTLDQVEKAVDPKCFFRINRKYIIQIDAIQDIVSFSNSRLNIKISGNPEDDAIVSREKVVDFKKWLDR
jgi:DNA-binding LytR/AlgR family response regulator